MKDLTRRRFLTHSSIGVALAGAIALVPFTASAMKRQVTMPNLGAGAPSSGAPLVAHVRDLASGEIAFLVGTQRIIIRDRELAARMNAAVRSSR